MKSLGVKGVYQLQGGVDKYFKAFEDGGHWKGKNYVFDKRFSHAKEVLWASPISVSGGPGWPHGLLVCLSLEENGAFVEGRGRYKIISPVAVS